MPPIELAYAVIAQGRPFIVGKNSLRIARMGPINTGYLDGSGIRSDEDPHRLFERIAVWLGPAGKALIEPWYAASVDGSGWMVGEAERQQSFDADGCRWQDRWRLKGRPEEAVKQSTHCYSLADLHLLAGGAGLALRHAKPGGTVDWEEGK